MYSRKRPLAHLSHRIASAYEYHSQIAINKFITDIVAGFVSTKKPRLASRCGPDSRLCLYESVKTATAGSLRPVVVLWMVEEGIHTPVGLNRDEPAPVLPLSWNDFMFERLMLI